MDFCSRVMEPKFQMIWFLQYKEAFWYPFAKFSTFREKRREQQLLNKVPRQPNVSMTHGVLGNLKDTNGAASLEVNLTAS